MKEPKVKFRRWEPHPAGQASVEVAQPSETDMIMVRAPAIHEYTHEVFCDERYVFEEVSHLDGDTTAFSPVYQPKTMRDVLNNWRARSNQ